MVSLPNHGPKAHIGATFGLGKNVLLLEFQTDIDGQVIWIKP